MKTIIQDFPTIYGEALNGSVYGQPNGSIARPPQNVAGTITLTATSATVTFESGSALTGIARYAAAGLTCSVDMANYAYIAVQVTDASNNVVCGATWNYGSQIDFNIDYYFGSYSNKPTNGDSLSIVATVYDQDGNVIVASSAAAATAVVS